MTTRCPRIDHFIGGLSSPTSSGASPPLRTSQPSGIRDPEVYQATQRMRRQFTISLSAIGSEGFRHLLFPYDPPLSLREDWA